MKISERYSYFCTIQDLQHNKNITKLHKKDCWYNKCLTRVQITVIDVFFKPDAKVENYLRYLRGFMSENQKFMLAFSNIKMNQIT